MAERLLRPLCCIAEFIEDPRAHLHRGLPGERNGQHVGRVYTSAEQVEIAFNQHRRFSGTCRRFEHEVVGRIYRQPPRIRRLAAR